MGVKGAATPDTPLPNPPVHRRAGWFHYTNQRKKRPGGISSGRFISLSDYGARIERRSFLLWAREP